MYELYTRWTISGTGSNRYCARGYQILVPTHIGDRARVRAEATARSASGRSANVTEAYICDAARTPIGRYGGSLAHVRADDLAAIPIRALIDRNPGVNWDELDDVIL